MERLRKLILTNLGIIAIVVFMISTGFVEPVTMVLLALLPMLFSWFEYYKSSAFFFIGMAGYNIVVLLTIIMVWIRESIPFTAIGIITYIFVVSLLNALAFFAFETRRE